MYGFYFTSSYYVTDLYMSCFYMIYFIPMISNISSPSLW